MYLLFSFFILYICVCVCVCVCFFLINEHENPISLYSQYSTTLIIG